MIIAQTRKYGVLADPGSDGVSPVIRAFGANAAPQQFGLTAPRRFSEKASFDGTAYWVWGDGEWVLWGDGDEIEI